MRRITSHSLRTLLIVALALALTPALAQGGPQGRGQFGPGPGSQGGPMDRLLDQLELTDEQRAQIDPLMDGHRDVMQGKTQAVRDLRDALADAIHASAFDEAAIRAAATDLGQAEADVAVERASMLQALRAELNPEQIEQMNEMIARHRERLMQGARRGGPGQGRFRGPGGGRYKNLDN